MTFLSMKQSELRENLIRKRKQPCMMEDSIAAMRLQEETTYRVEDFLPGYGKAALDKECREKICLWAFEVVDFCDYKRSTVAIAMNFLDRFMCTKMGRKQIRSKKSYQLAAMTTLFMAIKLFETVQMDVGLMADMSRGIYKPERILEMEKTILDGLEWRTNGPIALTFVQHFMSFLPSSVDPAISAAIMEQARYQTELAVCNYDLIQENQSQVALSAILNAMEALGGKALPFKTRNEFINNLEKHSNGVTCEDAETVRQYLEVLATAAVQTPLESIMEARIRAFDQEDSDARSIYSGEWSTKSKKHNKQEASPVCVSRQ
mmetsp:Transcript_32938/g.50388  ORF Transcript_32938/g.50388 Transcript_32938/m.50388 type:complete len:319 (+) Transcript_32938:140-1096(+)